MINQEQMQGKWWEIKGGIRNLWAKISDDELETTKGNLTAVASIVQEKYGETRESIQEKLDALFASFDNETDKADFYTSSYQRSPLGPDEGATSDLKAENDSNTSSTSQNIRDFDSDRNARH